MDEYIYLIPLPPGINEAVLSCVGGYTIYINEKLDEAGRLKAYQHAMRHINNGDFEIGFSGDVDLAEVKAHKTGVAPSGM